MNDFRCRLLTGLTLLGPLAMSFSSTLAGSRFQTDQPIEYVFAGIEASRKGIVSGQFTASVTVERLEKGADQHNTRIVVPVEHYRVMFAFDHSGQKYRIDREHPDLEATEFSVGTNVGQFVRLPTKSITQQPCQGTIAIHSINRPIPGWAKIFDYRALGIGTVGDLMSGESWEWIWEHTRAMRVEKIQALDNQTFEITLSHAKFKNSKRKLVLNESRGFWPVKMEFSDHIHSTLKVAEFNNTWVPIECVCNDGSTNLTISLSWSKVNDTLDEGLFDYHSFSSMPGTRVLDMRLGDGQPVLVEILGRQASDFVPESKWTRNLILAASIVIVAGSCLFCFRRKTTGKKI